MRFVDMKGTGAADVMVLSEGVKPEPKAGEIRIRVAYAGVNRPDIMQRKGLYPAPPDASPVLGLECSGVVDAVGEGANWALGAPVCALLPGGGYADFAVCDARHALPVPEGVSMEMAAALPETYFTVWSNVFGRAGLKSGEKFLVHGGSSGIGVAAIYLARAFGADVYCTVGSEAKRVFCENLGAVAMNYRERDFAEGLRAAGVQMDVILDMVGGDYVQKNINSLATEGRLVNIAFQKGARVELDMMRVMLKRLKLMGSTLRSQSDEAKAVIAGELRERVWPLLARGELRQEVFAVFDLADVAQAHEMMEAGAHMGKIVLKVS